MNLNLDFKSKLAIFFLVTIIVSTLPWRNYIENFATSDCGSFGGAKKCIPHKLTHAEARWVKPPVNEVKANLSQGIEGVSAQPGEGIKGYLTYKLCTNSNTQGDCLNNGSGKIRVQGIRVYSALPTFSIQSHTPNTDASSGLNWEYVENQSIVNNSTETENIGTNVLVGNPSDRPHTDVLFNPALSTDMIKLEYNITNPTKNPNQYNIKDLSDNVVIDFYDELATSQTSGN